MPEQKYKEEYKCALNSCITQSSGTVIHSFSNEPTATITALRFLYVYYQLYCPLVPPKP